MPSGVDVGWSPGTDDGNGEGRGAIGVVAGVVAIGAASAFADRGFLAGFALALAFGLAFALALRADRLIGRFDDLRTVFLAAFLDVFFFFLLAFALRFFAMLPSRLVWRRGATRPVLGRLTPLFYRSFRHPLPGIYSAQAGL